MNILVIAGEISGDLYASYLVKSIKSYSRDHTIYAVGGNKLKEESDHFLFHSAHQHGVSFAKQFFNSKFKKHLLESFTIALKKHTFDRVILIDFQHFNNVIASYFQSLSIPIYTFITPNFWMWKSKKKAKEIFNYSKKIICIFRPEYEFYKNLHPQTYYFGHPYTDIIDNSKSEPILSTSAPTITILPGSRPQEFSLYLASMLKTCALLAKLNPSLTILLPVSSQEYLPLIQSYLDQFPTLNVILHLDSAKQAILDSNLVIAASGSVCLEVILYHRPLIILAALPRFTYFFAKYILHIKLPFISLPNFLTNQYIIPEFIQSNISPNKITSYAQDMIQNPKKYLLNYSTIIKCLRYQKNVYSLIRNEVLN